MGAISDYIKKLNKAYQRGDASEHTYRGDLRDLIETLHPDHTATNEPRRIECGAPDYIISRGDIPVGYIEAKDIGKPLDLIEKEEQLKRYRDSLTNLILTDYLEFRWYRGGEPIETVRIASITSDGKIKIDKKGAESLITFFQNFCAAEPPEISNPKELADRMAKIGRQMRESIALALSAEGKEGSLHDQMEGFRNVLLHDLTAEQFADMYAQTICYGLFTARCYHKQSAGRFTRLNAPHELPKTNPFLRKLFGYIAGPDLDESVDWSVNDLAELLHRAKINAILRDFGKRTRQEDPVVHFYETFLAAYDPKMREARGVYYTPEPVVSYIVRSVDYLLQKEFDLDDGLANKTKVPNPADPKGDKVHKVQILDPATGTGTFLYGVINQIKDSFKGNEGMWSGYVSEHLLPRINGFELLMAPYAVAHLKLGLQLAETGYDFSNDERLHVYLTNTLDEPRTLDVKTPFATWLQNEGLAANRVKKDAPVMVVLGNPPYSGHSANKGKWIAELLRGIDRKKEGGVSKTENYFEVDGKPLGERNPKWLNDDYVKFIRFSQWRIEKTGYGILAFICNHGYLDNPTFRGMRQSLMETFDDIYILDLHGNAKKKEVCPDGSKDVNVFDIMQGVAIGIFVKKKKTSQKPATIRHSELWGLREVFTKGADGEKILTGGKYATLYEKEVKTTKWKKLEPFSPYYLFVPINTERLVEYLLYKPISEIFPLNSLGLTTGQDSKAVAFDENIMLDFASENGLSKDAIHDITYRPFDNRKVVYDKKTITRPRIEVLQHLLNRGNIAISSIRSQDIVGNWNHVFCSTFLMQLHSVSLKEVNYVYPLYQYTDVQSKKHDKLSLFDAPTTSQKRRPNLDPAFIEDVSAKLNLKFKTDGKGNLSKTFGPEDVFHYIYAIFHSPTYRKRYAEFLKIDFPRVPITSSLDLFKSLAKNGERLSKLHLMEAKIKPFTKFPIKGDNVVEKPRYEEPSADNAEGNVWINKTQYFKNVPPEVWNFHVGGYQVCHKWLKDRKGRELSFDDIDHYQKVTASLAETIEIMTEIDTTIDSHGGFPIT